MKSFIFLSGVMFVGTLFALSSCSTQDDKTMAPAAPAAPAAPPAKAEAKAPPAEAKTEKAGEAKAKATKVAGDVGLLDLEKNYMILVTKEGKLITIDFDPKITPTQRTQEESKMADVGLGSSAVVQYQKAGDKLKATSLEYTPAKGE
jgi:glucose/arabinose dehydrogenase